MTTIQKNMQNMTTQHDLPPLPHPDYFTEAPEAYYGERQMRDYAIAAIAPYKAENAKLRELLREARRFVEGDHWAVNAEFLARIDAELGEK